MKVDIFIPRLDIPFKKSQIPQERSSIPPLRLNWKQFCTHLYNAYRKKDHEVRMIEVPLWKITETTVSDISKEADIIYIPHKMKLNWQLDDRIRYYMQMVIPNIFSIDSEGWCASSSSWPIDLESWKESVETPNIFSHLESRVKKNISKFQQPSVSKHKLPEKFILFPCQIPHDETIRFHSDISVEDSLRALLASLQHFSDYSLVIKGHPANEAAMSSLKNIYMAAKRDPRTPISSKIFWIDNISIHQLLSCCSAVFTVNSGVGLEALLHSKKVYTFGNADYSSVSTKIMFGGSINNAALAIASEIQQLDSCSDFSSHNLRVQKFVNSWYYSHYDCTKPQMFDREVNAANGQ